MISDQETRDEKPDYLYVARRKPLTKKQRLEIYLLAGGRCESCNTKIAFADMIDEHFNPLWRALPDGPDPNDFGNRKCYCKPCAADKTATETTQRAKGRRVAKKHTTTGKITKTKPLPFGRNSRLKKKLNGKVVERDRK